MKLITFTARHRNLALFLAALALGGAAAVGARGYIAEQVALERERLIPQQQQISVVVAKRELVRGDQVNDQTMARRQVPADLVPGTAVLADQFESYSGARLVHSMRAGEPLLIGALENAGHAGFSTRVKAGIRAITVVVDEINSLSGMLQPGDRIDLLLSLRIPGVNNSPLAQEVTRPLMQDLRVLATGRQVRPGQDDRGPRMFTTITVEVSPVDAQKLVVAQRIGKLTATLRNPLDRGAIDARPMDIYRLLGLPAAPEPNPAPVSRGPEIIVGGQRPLLSPTQILSASAAPRASAVREATGAEFAANAASQTQISAHAAATSATQSTAQPGEQSASLLVRPGANH